MVEVGAGILSFRYGPSPGIHVPDVVRDAGCLGDQPPFSTVGRFSEGPAGGLVEDEESNPAIGRHPLKQRDHQGAELEVVSSEGTSLPVHELAPGRARALVPALAVGCTLAAATIAVSPLIRDGLRLDSAWSVVWMALMLPPMTVTGALQGVLLGRESYGRLSTVYLVTAGTRVLAALAATGLDFTVAEVFAEILGTHVQRLSTIARGDAACTTHVPRQPGPTTTAPSNDVKGRQVV